MVEGGRGGWKQVWAWFPGQVLTVIFAFTSLFIPGGYCWRFGFSPSTKFQPRLSEWCDFLEHLVTFISAKWRLIAFFIHATAFASSFSLAAIFFPAFYPEFPLCPGFSRHAWFPFSPLPPLTPISSSFIGEGQGCGGGEEGDKAGTIMKRMKSWK